jgi:hypothetical protein
MDMPPKAIGKDLPIGMPMKILKNSDAIAGIGREIRQPYVHTGMHALAGMLDMRFEADFPGTQKQGPPGEPGPSPTFGTPPAFTGPIG